MSDYVHLTPLTSMAKERYTHGDGSDVFVEASSVDLSKVKANSFTYIGEKRSIQLFYHGAEYMNSNDALVYGGITILYAGGNQVGILSDTYNFEIHNWTSAGETFRNVVTYGARAINYDWNSAANTLNPFQINFVGTATIGD